MTWLGSGLNARLGMALLAPAALVAPHLMAQEAQPDEVLGETPERYAQVRLLEGEATIRKGEVEEALGRGVPVAEGDVVESRGRGVLQLADGTRITFAPDTRFEISVLFADRDDGRIVVLRLDRGRLRVDMGSQEGVSLRIDCPVGGLRLQERSGATLIVQPKGEAQCRIQRGRAFFVNPQGRARLVAGDQLTVLGPTDGLDRIRAFNTYDEDSFDQWADDLSRAPVGESRTRVPQEIRHYADDLDGNGDWIRVEEVDQWVWRPRVTVAEWRPYWVGRWGCHPGGMTWISDEPWGFVTYHFGRWGWHARHGWYWVPGVYYSPAWVAWQSQDAYFGWAPLGIYNSPVSWGYGAWAGGGCWNILSFTYLYGGHVNRWVVSDGRAILNFRGQGSNWRRGHLLLGPNEWRDPHQIRRVLDNDSLFRLRLQDYERRAQQGTGRIVVRRGAEPEGRVPRPFERREDLKPAERFVPKERVPAGWTDPRPGPTPAPEGRAPRPQETQPRDTAPTPQPREVRPEGREARPREERRVDPAPREVRPEGREARPREERRVDPPREYRPEGREARPREERRVDPAPREMRPEGREARRPEPTPQPHPAPKHEPKPEPKPAPKPKPETRQN